MLGFLWVLPPLQAVTAEEWLCFSVHLSDSSTNSRIKELFVSCLVPTPRFRPHGSSNLQRAAAIPAVPSRSLWVKEGFLQVINPCQHSVGFVSAFPYKLPANVTRKGHQNFAWSLAGWASVLVLITSDTTRCLSVRESLSEVHQKPQGVWDLGYICRANKHRCPDAGFPGWGNGLWRSCGVESSLSNQHSAAWATSPSYRPAYNFQLHRSLVFYFFYTSHCLNKWWILRGGVWAISPFSPQWLEEQNLLHASHSYDYELKNSGIKPRCGQLACSVLLSRCPTGENSSRQVRREHRI